MTQDENLFLGKITLNGKVIKKYQYKKSYDKYVTTHLDNLVGEDVYTCEYGVIWTAKYEEVE